MKRKINYIIGMIWWQFRGEKIKRRLFERIKEVQQYPHLASARRV